MIIKIEVKNDILGDSTHWIGDSSKISEIRNIPAAGFIACCYVLL